MSNPFTPPSAESGSFLKDIIPVHRRKQVYAAYGLLGGLFFVLTGAVILVTGEVPVWLLVVNLVYTGISPFFAGLAGANARDNNEVQA